MGRGRGRGKGKKLTGATRHDDPGSAGEEVIPICKRRGRPYKDLKGEVDGDDVVKMEVDEGEENVKVTGLKQEPDGTMENGKKRRMMLTQIKISNSALEENGIVLNTNNDDPTMSNGFRHSGSRRKSKPHRAAEAGVECN